MKRSAGGRRGSAVAGGFTPRVNGRRVHHFTLGLPMRNLRVGAASRSAGLRLFWQRWRGIMSRVGLSAAIAAVLGVSLTGCSSALSSNSSSEQLQALNFESDPPGAEIRTTQGETCITPCELTVPSHEQPVTVSKSDYVPQTIQVAVGPQPDHSFWQNPPPTLVPNPVHVVLQPVPKPVHHAEGRRSASKTHTAKRTPAPNAASAPVPSASPSPPPPPPPAQAPAATTFPPPPSQQ